MNWALLSVARKEVLHIARDWRIVALVLALPPLVTLLMGHAFEVTAMTEVPTILHDQDQSTESRELADYLATKETFAWKKATVQDDPDLLRAGVQGVVIIPKGWGAGIRNGEPVPLRATLDGSDTVTAPVLEGMLEQSLGEYQLKARDAMVDTLPDEIIEMGKKLPVDFRNRVVSSLSPWKVETKVVYNPQERFIDFVAPGIIGLILQLITVPLLAVTLTRERETGTLLQLMLTTLRHGEIVIGKVLPYLVLSLFSIAVVMGIMHWHFAIVFSAWGSLAVLCFLFLLCSLGLGLVISAFCNTQAQAVQLAVFFLVPIIPLCGAFAPLEQLPEGVRSIAEVFPLTHFCRAFRAVHLAGESLSFVLGDMAFLLGGAIVTFVAAALLLGRSEA